MDKKTISNMNEFRVMNNFITTVFRNMIVFYIFIYSTEIKTNQ